MIDAVMLFEVEYSANIALSLSGAVVAGSVVSVARLSSVVVNKLAQDYRLSSAACWERKRASNRAAHQATAAEPADKPSGAAQVVPHLDLSQANAKSKPKRTIGESDDDDDDNAEVEEEEEREIDDFSPRPAATSPEAASGAAVPKAKESSHSKVQVMPHTCTHTHALPHTCARRHTSTHSPVMRLYWQQVRRGECGAISRGSRSALQPAGSRHGLCLAGPVTRPHSWPVPSAL